MKLEEQTYQILDRGDIEFIGHTELLGVNKQIIRMREGFFNTVQTILRDGGRVSLYNHYNPINSDLLRKYHQEDSEEYNGAMIAKIIDDNQEGPILDGGNLIQVTVSKMFNVFLEEIDDEDLQKSIAFHGKQGTVADLLEWMSKEFYGGRLTIEDIEKYQRLFFRQIILPNTNS